MITLSVARSTKGNDFIWTRDTRSVAGKERGGKLRCAGEAVELVFFAVATIFLSFRKGWVSGAMQGLKKKQFESMHCNFL